jgi:hypothetical protein
MLYRIVAVDPGQTTGLTAFTVNDNEISCVDSYELDLVGIGDYFETMKIGPGVTVCYEVANKFHASGHMSSEVIGIVKYFALKGGADLVSVTQSAHKRLISRDVLKRAGLYVPGGHAKDAASVGLFHVVGNWKQCQHVLRPEEAT